MEKKNTILLTVIAVATLLVAVVGATFAYYSASTTIEDSTSTFTGTTTSIGSITLSSPTPTLGLTLTPEDMAQYGEDKKYYALKTEAESEAPETSSGVYGTSKKEYPIAQAKLTGGSAGTSYTCTANLVVTLTKSEGSMGSVLETGDAILYFTANNATINVGEQKETSTSLDLASIKVDGTKTYPITYNVSSSSTEASINADLEIVNKTADDQAYLAGTKGAGATLTVTINSQNLNCNVVPTATD